MRWFISLTLRHCATSYSDTMVSSSKHYPKSIDRNKYTKVWITSQTTVINSTQAKRGWKNSASTFPKKESKACQMPRVSSNLSQPPWNANVWQSSFSQSLKSTWWNGWFPTSFWLLQCSLFQQRKSLGLTLCPFLSFMWKATLHGWLADARQTSHHSLGLEQSDNCLMMRTRVLVCLGGAFSNSSIDFI